MEKTHRLDVAVVDGAPVADDALQTLHDVIHGGAAAALLLAVVVDHGGHRQHRSHLQGVVLQQLLQNPFLLVTWCVCVCMRACVRACVRVCVYSPSLCVCTPVCLGHCVCAHVLVYIVVASP